MLADMLNGKNAQPSPGPDPRESAAADYQEVNSDRCADRDASGTVSALKLRNSPRKAGNSKTKMAVTKCPFHLDGTVL